MLDGQNEDPDNDEEEARMRAELWGEQGTPPPPHLSLTLLIASCDIRKFQHVIPYTISGTRSSDLLAPSLSPSPHPTT